MYSDWTLDFHIDHFSELVRLEVKDDDDQNDDNDDDNS